MVDMVVTNTFMTSDNLQKKAGSLTSPKDIKKVLLFVIVAVCHLWPCYVMRYKLIRPLKKNKLNLQFLFSAARGKVMENNSDKTRHWEQRLWFIVLK